MSFKIYEKEGRNFAKKSGDFNLIHLDNIVGYNSIYGEKICHGCLVFLKLLKFKEIKNEINSAINNFKAEIIFHHHFSYNKNITLIGKKKIYLKQGNILCAEVKLTKNKIQSINKLQNKKNLFNKLELILNNISKYTGMIKPGKNSILGKIEVNYDINNKYNRKLSITVKTKDNRIPIIFNELKYQNFIVKFNTIIRPALLKSNDRIDKKTLNKIKAIKRNIMIIGGSQGIGEDLLNLLKKNKKIKIISTFHKNKISPFKNIIVKKIDLNRDLLKVKKLIYKYSPINIYYFASCKIYFDNYLANIYKKDYQKYFIDFPTKIIKMNYKKDICFFYPSTQYININGKSVYAKIKKKAEKKISNLCNKLSVKYKIIRLDAINTRQTINLISNKSPSLYIYLRNNLNLIDDFLFLNSK